IRQLIIQQSEGNRTDIAGSRANNGNYGRAIIRIGNGGQGCGTAIVRKPKGHSCPRRSDLLIRIVRVLVTDIAEELVLDNGTTQRSTSDVAVQFWNFV